MANIDEIRKKAEDSKNYHEFEKGLADDERKYFENNKENIKDFYSSVDESRINIVKGKDGKLEIEGLSEAMEEIGIEKEEIEQSEKEVTKMYTQSDKYVTAIFFMTIVIIIAVIYIISLSYDNNEYETHIKKLETKIFEKANIVQRKPIVLPQEFLNDLYDSIHSFEDRIRNTKYELIYKNTELFASQINELYQSKFKNKTIDSQDLIEFLIDYNILSVRAVNSYFEDNYEIELDKPKPYEW